MKPFHFILAYLHVSFGGQIIDGVAMGSSLSPVIANFFVGDIGEVIFSSAAHNLLCWLCYMDVTFVYSTQTERLP